MDLAGALTVNPSAVPFVRPLHDLALSHPLAAIRAVAELRCVLADAEALAIVTARKGRLGWREIAEPLDMDHRTAHRHFRHLDPLEGGRGRNRSSAA